MAVPLEEANKSTLRLLSTFSLENEQPGSHGSAIAVSTNRGATQIEYNYVSAYLLSLSEDTKALKQLNALIQEGKEMTSVLSIHVATVSKHFPRFTLTLLEATKKARRLNNHILSILKAHRPLQDKTACAIKQSIATLHRIEFENTVLHLKRCIRKVPEQSPISSSTTFSLLLGGVINTFNIIHLWLRYRLERICLTQKVERPRS